MRLNVSNPKYRGGLGNWNRNLRQNSPSREKKNSKFLTLVYLVMGIQLPLVQKERECIEKQGDSSCQTQRQPSTIKIEFDWENREST